MTDGKPDIEAGLQNVLQIMERDGRASVVFDREDLRRLLDGKIIDFRVTWPVEATLEEAVDTDPYIPMLREFNLAFGGRAALGEPETAPDGRALPMPMYSPLAPSMLFLSENGEALIGSYVLQLEAMAAEIKRRTSPLNDSGQVVAGAAMTRLQLSIEELAEFWRAVLDTDLVQVIDALADRQYVLDGDALLFGLGDLKREAVQIVHAANMRKLGPDGKPVIGTNGRVTKPEGWEGPERELAELLERHLQAFRSQS